MKQLTLRLMAVGVVLAIGTIAIVQALNHTPTIDAPSDQEPRVSVPQPIPVPVEYGQHEQAVTSALPPSRFSAAAREPESSQYHAIPTPVASDPNSPSPAVQAAGFGPRSHGGDLSVDQVNPLSQQASTATGHVESTAANASDFQQLPQQTAEQLRQQTASGAYGSGPLPIPPTPIDTSEQADQAPVESVSQQAPVEPREAAKSGLTDVGRYGQYPLSEANAENQPSQLRQNTLPSPLQSILQSAPAQDRLAQSAEAVPRVEPAPSAFERRPIISASDDTQRPLEQEGTGTPGSQTLEGMQSPTLSLEKIAPAEIQVGKSGEFQVIVRNTGQVAVHDVVLRDEVPQGTRLLSTTPPATTTEDGAMWWQLGTLEPAEDTTITMQLMPLVEGEIGSVATATFQAQASARTVSTRPLLKLEHTSPPKVHVGDMVTFTIRISNPGSGSATSVILEEDVPEGLIHAAGKSLEFEIGTLAPGETRELDLILTAEKAGTIENVIVARADANLVVESRLELDVISPKLRVSLLGPGKRYLERPATYTISVANPGTAPAKDIELIAHLPKGMKLIETNNAGQYDPATHAVFWSLEQLPPAQMGSAKFTALPIEVGQLKLRVEGRAKMGLTDTFEKTVLVDGLASLFFNVLDSADPIEVGRETTFEVHLVNKGSKTSTNIRVEAICPPGLKPLEGDGTTRGEVVGNRVIFQPLNRLEPKATATFNIRVQGLAPGDQRLRVHVLSDEMESPVSEEESTRVYADS